MTLGRLVRRGFGAILVLALAASVYTFAQSSSTPPSSGPVDPGVRKEAEDRLRRIRR